MHLRALVILSGSLMLLDLSGISSAQILQAGRMVKYPIDGDAPEDPGPLAKDLSARLERRDVKKVIRRVGDWQLKVAKPLFVQDWTYAALYAGFMAVPQSVAGDRYRSAMFEMGEGFQWQPGKDEEFADDQAVSQTYLELYIGRRDVTLLKPTQERMDRELIHPDDPAKDLWWWSDALFMAPPVLSRLYKITGNDAYLDFMDRQWSITSEHLYDRNQHLFSRDASFIPKHEKNGAKVFWSRGNGWVLAGLVRILQDIPEQRPSRIRYISQLREMADMIASLQGADGLWRPGLLDAADYPLPEISGSCFFLYAMAWGVNHGILDRAKYGPVITRGWTGVVSHVYQDGRLGSIQPGGAGPGPYPASSSRVFGVGAFLLAGSEIYRLAN